MSILRETVRELTGKGFDYVNARKEYNNGEKDLVNVVLRNKGGKKEYNEMFNWIKYNKKPKNLK